MLRIGGKIPITITPAFWITAVLIGFLGSRSVFGTLIWVGIILVSVLFHELGHALAALCFGQKPRIELVALGGLTYHDAEKLPFWKQFIIVFNGPFFGFLLFLFASFLHQFPPFDAGVPGTVVLMLGGVNLFWTVLNLLPVLPLDGGQLMRIPLEACFGLKGLRSALLVSMIVAFLASLAAFLLQYFLVGAILFLFAFQGFDTWKRSRLLSEPDQDTSVKSLVEKGEFALQAGDKQTAKRCFEEVQAKVKKGVSHLLAVQYLAFLENEQGNLKEAYRLLLPEKKNLSPDALCLLHSAAFAAEDFSLVEELGGICFQSMPSVDIALHTAYACALLKNPRAVIGWLEAAIAEGLQDVPRILQDKRFDPVRSDPLMQVFLHKTHS